MTKLNSKWFVVIGMLLALKCSVSHGDPVHVFSPGVIDITTSKVVHITDEVDVPAEYQFEREVASTLLIPGPQVIMIDSPGGRVDVGSEMIRLMMLEKSMDTKIVCVVTGDANSMAFNFLTFCDVRLATAGSHFIVHKIALSGTGEERLTAKFLRQMADILDKMDEQFRQANASAMHLSLDDYDKFADEQHEWSSPMLYSMGYLNGIADVQYTAAN